MRLDSSGRRLPATLYLLWLYLLWLVVLTMALPTFALRQLGPRCSPQTSFPSYHPSRLLTGAADGVLRLRNFSSGELMTART